MRRSDFASCVYLTPSWTNVHKFGPLHEVLQPPNVTALRFLWKLRAKLLAGRGEQLMWRYDFHFDSKPFCILACHGWVLTWSNISLGCISRAFLAERRPFQTTDNCTSFYYNVRMPTVNKQVSQSCAVVKSEKNLASHWTIKLGRQNGRLLHWPKCSCVSIGRFLRPAICMIVIEVSNAFGAHFRKQHRPFLMGATPCQQCQRTISSALTFKTILIQKLFSFLHLMMISDRMMI